MEKVSVVCFKKSIKSYFLNDYSYVCNLNNCYICQAILRQNPPRENPTGQNPPTKTTQGQNSPVQNPPGQNLPDKTPLDKTPRTKPPGQNPPGQPPPCGGMDRRLKIPHSAKVECGLWTLLNLN